MEIITKELIFDSKGNTDIIDISDEVAEIVSSSGIKSAMAFIFVVGSTAGITTCEYEPALEKDLKRIFEKLIPKNVEYDHDATWGDANGFSHLRASLLKPSLAIPVIEGALSLGTWQQIVLIDFDNRPRRRKIIVQLQGQ